MYTVAVTFARKHVLTLVLCAAWSGWLSWTQLGYGPQSYYRQHDTAEANGAFYIGQPAFAARGLLGDWTPTAGSGVDARANGKGVQPLFEGLFRAAPFWWTAGVVLLAETFASAFFTVLLLRRIGVLIAPALLAGFAASMMYDGHGAFSGFFLGSGLYVPLFPVVLLTLMHAGEAPAWRSAALAAACAIGVGLSSGPILVLLSLPVIALWMFCVERGSVRHAVVLLLFAAGVAIFATPMLAAMASHAFDAHRIIWPTITFGADDAAKWQQRGDEATLLLRVTAPLLAPAVIAVLAGGVRRRALAVLTLASGGIIALVALMVPVRGALQAIAPALATFQFDRVTQFLPFLSAAAGGVGLDYLLRGARGLAGRWTRRVASTVCVAAIVAVAAVLAGRAVAINRHRDELRRQSSSYAGMLAQPELASLAAAMRGQPPARVVTFADRNEAFGGQHPGFAWAHGLETVDGYLNLYPLRYHTFWSWLIEPALAQRPDLQDYFDDWGNMFYLFNPHQALPAPVTLSSLAHANLLALANVRYVISPVALEDPSLIRWPGTPGTPTAEVQWTTAASGARLRKLFVYEKQDWLPRAFVAEEVRGFTAPDALLGALRSASVDDLRRVAFVEAPSPAAAGALPSVSTAADARIVEYSADRLTIDVVAPRGGMLVVTNGYDRYWRAWVGDRPGVIVPADFAFQGIALPAGASRVRLEYAPPYAIPAWACAAAVAALALVAALAAPLARRAAMPRPRRRYVFGAIAACAAVAVAVGLTRPGDPLVPWADASAPMRIPVRLLPRALSTPVDLPVLIERGPDDAAFWAALPDGAAVRFTDAAGRPIDAEIEIFDPASRRLAVWVKMPAFGWGDRVIYLYAGGSVPDTNTAGSVWTSGYVAVWHLNDAGGAGVARDSTARGHDGVMTARAGVPGRIGGAAPFDGSSRITVADSDDWSFGAEDWAIEAWLKPEPQERRNFGIVEHGPGGRFQLYLHGGNMFVLERNDGVSARDHSFAGIGLEAGAWQHVALARAGARLSLHVNGEPRAFVHGSAFVHADPVDALTIGMGAHGGWHGAIDELRISRAPRPPGWSRAIYLSQTGALTAFGAVETRAVNTVEGR